MLRHQPWGTPFSWVCDVCRMPPRLVGVGCDSGAGMNESGQVSVLLQEVYKVESLFHLFQIIISPFQCILQRKWLHMQYYVTATSCQLQPGGARVCSQAEWCAQHP